MGIAGLKKKIDIEGGKGMFLYYVFCRFLVFTTLKCNRPVRNRFHGKGKLV